MAIPRNLANFATTLDSSGQTPKIQAGDSNVTVADTGSNGTITFTTDNTESMRVDSGQRLLKGATSLPTGISYAGFLLTGKSSGSMLDNRFLAQIYGESGSGGPYHRMYKTRGTDGVTNTIVQSGDETGVIEFLGANGTGYNATAQILSYVDGTPGASNDMPGRLVFATTSDGAASPSERMRITNSGIVSINGSNPSTGGVNSGILTVTRPAFNSSSDISYAIFVTGGTGSGSSGTEQGGIKIRCSSPNYITGYGLNVDMSAASTTGQTTYGMYSNIYAGSSYSNSAACYLRNEASTVDGNYGSTYGLYATSVNSSPTHSGISAYLHAANKVNTYCLVLDDAYSTSSTKIIVGITRNSSSVGSITTTLSSTAYNTSSDYRLKENVAPLTNALDDVLKINPVTFTWKSTGEQAIGFIAHELQEIVPQAVSGEKDAVKIEAEKNEDGTVKKDSDGNVVTKEVPVYQGVDSSFLVAHLVKAIQELKAELDAAKQRITILEAK